MSQVSCRSQHPLSQSQTHTPSAASRAAEDRPRAGGVVAGRPLPYNHVCIGREGSVSGHAMPPASVAPYKPHMRLSLAAHTGEKHTGREILQNEVQLSKLTHFQSQHIFLA